MYRADDSSTTSLLRPELLAAQMPDAEPPSRGGTPPLAPSGEPDKQEKAVQSSERAASSSSPYLGTQGLRAADAMELAEHERFWSRHQPRLAACGYTLRKRYQQGWKPSWTANSSLEGVEDAIVLPVSLPHTESQL